MTQQPEEQSQNKYAAPPHSQPQSLPAGAHLLIVFGVQYRILEATTKRCKRTCTLFILLKYNSKW